MRITNNFNISLPLAVWLVHDTYDYQDLPNYFSVTTLMRPLKQIILPGRIPQEEVEIDVSDLIARKLGNAIHDSIEKAWKEGAHRSLRLLGFPEDVVRRIVVDPTTEQFRTIKDIIPVYLEHRAHRKIVVDGTEYNIGGKFDMTSDGILNDNKSTSAYGWVYGTREDEHQLQMSLYRWIDAAQNPPKVTEDFCNVNYVFTDWQKAQAKSNPAYPQQRVEQKTLSLKSTDETEAFVVGKLRLISQNRAKPEEAMPPCTDEELWRSEPKYKYFSDPAKAQVPGARSTKNFDNLADANKHKTDCGKGVVVTVPGEVKACGYCPAFQGCKQKDLYFS